MLFLGGYNLKYHVAHHINAREFSCDQCQQAYNTQSDLNQHKRSHDKYKPALICSECGMMFQIASRLKTHMKIHQSNECKICKKDFVRLETHHRLVHLGLKEFECKFCEKSFGKKSGLDRHMSTMHKKPGKFQCNVGKCTEFFDSKEELDLHTFHSHKGLKCDIESCGQLFSEKSKLIKHLNERHGRTLAYCIQCKSFFDDIEGHYETAHKDLKFACHLCFKRFAKQSSRQIHFGTCHNEGKEYVCDRCPNKKFAHKYAIQRHLNRHLAQLQQLVAPKEEPNEHEVLNDGYVSDDSIREDSKYDPTTSLNSEIKIERCSEAVESLTEPYFLQIKSEIISGDDDMKTVKQEPIDETDFDFDDGCIDSSTELYDDIKFEQEEMIEQTSDTSHLLDEEEKPIKAQVELKIPIKEKSTKQPNKKKSRAPLIKVPEQVDSSHIEAIDEKPEFCYGCAKEFIVRREFIQHFETHRTKYGFSCQTCGKEVRKRGDLKNHYYAIHTDHKFECEQCKKSFTYKSALDRHIKIVHENKRDYVCSDCNQVFGIKYDLIQHQERHHDDSKKADLTCTVCEKIFAKKRNLQEHILAVHNEKSFECEICLKMFSYKLARDRHLKTFHGNLKTHSCNQCQKSFESQVELENHAKYVHSSNAIECLKYNCLPCKKSFASPGFLSRHQKTAHESGKPNIKRGYRCKFCQEIFYHKYQQQKHLSQVHQNGLNPMRTCQLCSLDFHHFVDFKSHIEGHVGLHICLICGIYCLNEQEMTTHKEEHKLVDVEHRKYSCDICGHKTFNKILLKVSKLSLS